MHANLRLSKLSITEGEQLGNGPEGLQAGDEIWVLKGGKMPLILRPSKEPRAMPELGLEAALCYILVRQCYLDGIIDRETADILTADAVDVFII